MHKLKNKNNKMIIDHDDNDSRFLNNNPSFSSTLLDQIYRSIDQGDTRSPEMRFYRETTTKKKQSNKQKTETKTLDNKRRENNKVSENYVVGTEKTCRRRRSRDEHVDQDAMFFNSFSSASFSSDSCSSSGGFSSSDTESLYGTRSSRVSCFAPLRPKPVRTSMSFRSEEQGDRKFHSFRHDSTVELGVSIGDYDESALIKSKSRALKIYNNLKKVKQPISPGGKITSFLNSIFTNSKKTRSTHEDTPKTTTKSYFTERRSRIFEQEDGVVSSKLAQTSTTNYCSSASSFSRSCLSKTNSSEREKLCNRVKRKVRFYPVSVVVGEDCRPYGDKEVCELEEGDNKKSPMKNTIVEKSRVVEEAAREFLDEYRRNNNNNNKNDLVLKDLNLAISNDDDEDTASCASSDLFELDHLAVFGSGRYSEELPVYETTHVGTNRAIANGFIL